MKKSADQWFAEYGESHQHAANKTLHWICVPLIVASLLGLLWAIPVPHVFAAVPYLNWATLLILLSLIFYVRLSIPLAIGMLLFSAAVVVAIRVLEASSSVPVWQVALAIFAGAWIGQFIGHKIEGRKPSFFQDLQFLLIGPIWLLGFMYRKTGIRY